MVRNTRAVLAIEALAAARALDLLAPLKTSPLLEEARERIRARLAAASKATARSTATSPPSMRLIACGALRV